MGEIYLGLLGFVLKLDPTHLRHNPTHIQFNLGYGLNGQTH